MIELAYYLGVPALIVAVVLIVVMYRHEGEEDRNRHRRYYEETRIKPPTRS